MLRYRPRRVAASRVNHHEYELKGVAFACVSFCTSAHSATQDSQFLSSYTVILCPVRTHSPMAQATRDAEGFVVGISNIPEDEDFVVYGTIYANPGSADALEAVYAETTRLAQNEPGTVYYCICRV